MPNSIQLFPQNNVVSNNPTAQLSINPANFIGINPFGQMSQAVIFGAVDTLLGWIDQATGLDLLGMVLPLQNLLGSTAGLLGSGGLMGFLTPGTGTTGINVFSPLLSGLGLGTLGGFLGFLNPTTLLAGGGLFGPLLSLLSLGNLGALGSFMAPNSGLIGGVGIFGPILSAGSIFGSLIPGLDASKIITGTFGAGVLQPLINAISSGFGGGSGLGFGGLTSMLSAIPGAGAILNTFVNTFLGLPGSGFGIPDLLRSIQSIPASLITGTLAPGMASNLGVGHISNVIPELLTNPNFDAANSIVGQTGWTWDGTQGPGSLMTSVFADAGGVLRELFSNVINVAPGQVLNISANTKWGNSFSGGANSIALTVAQFAGGVLSSYSTIGSIASPGSSGGWSLLSGSYTVPGGIDSIFVRPVVTAGATAGRVWFGGMSVKSSSTNLLANLVPGLDASKIVSGFFGMSQITGLLTGFTNLFPAATVNNNGTATPSPLSSSITLNGNGTATYVQDSLTQLLNMGNGTFSTPFNLIQNLGGIAGKLQGLSAQQPNIVSTITGALGGTGSSLSDLANVFGAIPANNVLGVAGISGMGSTMQGTWDQLYQAFSFLTGSNNSLSAVVNAAHGVANAATNAQSQAATNSNLLSAFIGARPVSHGLDPTAVASYNLAQNSNTALNATSTVAPMSFKVIAQPTTFGNFETVAYKTGTVTNYYLNVYKMDNTGALTAVYNSADLAGQLSTTSAPAGWVRTGAIPAVNQVSTVAGDVLAIESVVVGSGSVTLRSQSTGIGNHPTALLKNFAASRNPTGNLTPVTISAATMSSAYSANQPWHSGTIVSVPPGWQPPQTWTRSVANTYTYTIPAFAKVVGTKLYLIVLGAGGGGQGNYGAFVFFTGGNAGSWAVQTLVCGTDYPTTATTLTVVVGAAGAAAGAYWTNGRAGAASTAQWTDMSSVVQTLTAAGGTGGGNSGTSGSNGKGPSPNPEVYGGVSYFGGTAVGGNQNGSSPGGGGGGAGPGATGNPGADGAVWIVASQT